MGDQVTAIGTPVDPATLPQRPTEPDCAVSTLFGTYNPSSMYLEPS